MYEKHACIRQNKKFTLEPREFNKESVHHRAEENKVSEEVIEQELLNLQWGKSKVKPRKTKPLVFKRERA